jgi:hypothetical protein
MDDEALFFSTEGVCRRMTMVGCLFIITYTHYSAQQSLPGEEPRGISSTSNFRVAWV